MNSHHPFFCLILCLYLITGCAINPVTGENDFVTMSEEDEVARGQHFHQKILQQYGVYDDPKLQAYVNGIGQRLAAKSHRSHLTFHFTVLDSSEINAFALPGGYIYITRGIMAYLNSEAEIAGVLGHEIGHVTARHSVRQEAGMFASSLFNIFLIAVTGNEQYAQLGQTISTGIVRGYGREHELEADKLGAEYLHHIGHDPESMLQVIGVLKDQETYEKVLAKKQNRKPHSYHGVYATHPKNDKRLKTVIRAAKKLSTRHYLESNAGEYLRMINGLVWGQNIKQGVLINNRFLHPGLAISLQFPMDWQVTNTPNAIIAQHFDTRAFVQMTLIDLEANESLADLLRRQASSNTLNIETSGNTVRATTQVSNGNQQQPAQISAIGLNEKQAVFLFATSPKTSFDETGAALTRVSKSFSRLNRQQVADIKSPRLRIITAKKDASFSALAKASIISYEAENTLRLLNRAFPNGTIKSGHSLKTIKVDD